MIGLKTDLMLKMGLKLLSVPICVDDQLCEAAFGQTPNMPVNQCPATHLEQRLGRTVSQRAHALTASGSQYQGRNGHMRLIMACFGH